MTGGLQPANGANGPEWDRPLEGHSGAKRDAADIYALDVWAAALRSGKYGPVIAQVVLAAVRCEARRAFGAVGGFARPAVGQ